MFALLSPLKKFNKYLKHNEICTDGIVFRIHCILTASILIATSLLLTATQYIGSPIECLGAEEKKQKAINTFCWIQSTFTVPGGFTKEIGSEAAAPGVMTGTKDGEVRRYVYYQWVCFVLFFQGLLCYLPKVLWDASESKLLITLASGINPFCPCDVKKKKTNCIVEYFNKYKGMHQRYAYSYWGCELLCFVNILAQMMLMDKFLQGQFLSYGTKLLQLHLVPIQERVDPMVFVFPRVTKCTYYQYGHSGTIQNLDNMCLLPQNILNEKTYILLWFWYIVLAALLGTLLLYRLAIILMPSFRTYLLLTRSRARTVESRTAVKRAARRADLDIGDWWLLYLLSKNIDSLSYMEFIEDLVVSLNKNKYDRMDTLEMNYHKPIVSILEICDDDSGNNDGEKVVEIMDES